MHQIRALILDDDIWALRLMAGMLTQCFPEVQVETRTEPNATGDFDLFFIDNQFDDKAAAVELAHTIRQDNPDSLIIAFSGTLDGSTLRELLNGGCNGACDKSNPADLPRAMEIAGQFIERLKEQNQPKKHGLLSATNAIRDLLREWNTRLDRESA